MDNYLIDRETLGQFVDELMKRKPLPVNTAEELNALREKSIQELDDSIGHAVFGALNEEQLVKVNGLLDNHEESPEVFQDFFASAGVDLEKVITDAMQQYSAKFLGGTNAE